MDSNDLEPDSLSEVSLDVVYLSLTLATSLTTALVFVVILRQFCVPSFMTLVRKNPTHLMWTIMLSGEAVVNILYMASVISDNSVFRSKRVCVGAFAVKLFTSGLSYVYLLFITRILHQSFKAPFRSYSGRSTAIMHGVAWVGCTILTTLMVWWDYPYIKPSRYAACWPAGKSVGGDRGWVLIFLMNATMGFTLLSIAPVFVRAWKSKFHSQRETLTRCVYILGMGMCIVVTTSRRLFLLVIGEDRIASAALIAFEVQCIISALAVLRNSSYMTAKVGGEVLSSLLTPLACQHRQHSSRDLEDEEDMCEECVYAEVFKEGLEAGSGGMLRHIIINAMFVGCRQLAYQDCPVVIPKGAEVKAKMKARISVTDESSVPFICTSYNPTEFRYVRASRGMSTQDYVRSLAPSGPDTVKKSEGRSGSFFSQSQDGQLCLKELTRKESQTLRLLTKEYAGYLASEPQSRLVRYLGHHKVWMATGQTVYFVVMENILPPEGVKQRFDIKGSWVHRKVSSGSYICPVAGFPNESEGSNDESASDSLAKPLLAEGPSPLGYDVDFNLQRSCLILEKSMRCGVLRTLERDAKFLQKMGMMDYSLLIGVAPATLPTVFSATLNRKNLYVTSSASGDELYFMAVVDVLCPYSAKKRIERFLKRWVFLRDGKGISVMPPESYASRFCKHMERILVGSP